LFVDFLYFFRQHRRLHVDASYFFDDVVHYYLPMWWGFVDKSSSQSAWIWHTGDRSIFCRSWSGYTCCQWRAGLAGTVPAWKLEDRPAQLCNSPDAAGQVL